MRHFGFSKAFKKRNVKEVNVSTLPRGNHLLAVATQSCVSFFFFSPEDLLFEREGERASPAGSAQDSIAGPWPEPKSRVRCSTNWATQGPLCVPFCALTEHKFPCNERILLCIISHLTVSLNVSRYIHMHLVQCSYLLQSIPWHLQHWCSQSFIKKWFLCYFLINTIQGSPSPTTFLIETCTFMRLHLRRGVSGERGVPACTSVRPHDFPKWCCRLCRHRHCVCALFLNFWPPRRYRWIMYVSWSGPTISRFSQEPWFSYDWKASSGQQVWLPAC